MVGRHQKFSETSRTTNISPRSRFQILSWWLLLQQARTSLISPRKIHLALYCQIVTGWVDTCSLTNWANTILISPRTWPDLGRHINGKQLLECARRLFVSVFAAFYLLSNSQQTKSQRIIIPGQSLDGFFLAADLSLTDNQFYAALGHSLTSSPDPS